MTHSAKKLCQVFQAFLATLGFLHLTTLHLLAELLWGQFRERIRNDARLWSLSVAEAHDVKPRTLHYLADLVRCLPQRVLKSQCYDNAILTAVLASQQRSGKEAFSYQRSAFSSPNPPTEPFHHVFILSLFSTLDCRLSTPDYVFNSMNSIRGVVHIRILS